MFNPEMQFEWEAWQNINREFRALNVDMNEMKYNKLIRAIEYWGERLAALRSYQEDLLRDDILRQKEQRYLEIATPKKERE